MNSLCTHKFDNLAEMDQLLERNNLPTLAQEKIIRINRTIYVKEI